MSNANDASQATSAFTDSIKEMDQFDQEIDQVAAFVTTHMVDYEISPAAQLWVDRAKEQAYLRSNPTEGLRFLHRARVAALRYHAGQTILQANSLKERLGQKASKQASFLLGRAQIAFGERNLTLSIKESTQALELFTKQVKQIEETKPAAVALAPQDQRIFQIPVLKGPNPDIKKMVAEEDRRIREMQGEKPQKEAKKKTSKGGGKKRQITAVA